MREARSTVPLALRQLRREEDGVVRVALVQSGAMLVEGDDLAVDVVVGPGAALELCEISATLAHPMRRGSRWRLSVEAHEGARVVVAEEPLVVAAGASVEREVAIAIAPGARLLHRDTLVLGRHGEPGGAVHGRTRVTRAGRPVLDDTLTCADPVVRRSPAVLGSARVVASLALFGTEVEPAGFELASGDRLVRRLGASVREVAEVDVLQRRWRAAVLDGA